MPKRMMSFKERKEELKKGSQHFLKDYPTTAKWIQHLAETLLLPKVTVTEVSVYLEDIRDSFKIEYIGTDENAAYRSKCYDEFIKIVWGMIKKQGKDTPKTFENLIPAQYLIPSKYRDSDQLQLTTH